MPARQPSRPAPKAAKAPKSGGGKGASRGGAKGAAKGRAGNARKGAPPPKGAAKGKQPVKGAAKGKQPPGKPSAAEQQRQRRIMLDQQRREREARWWAINQAAVNTLHSTQHHAAGGEAIGTVLNGDRRLRWRTSHAVGAITLLILSAFFASMALGAQSAGVGVLAFLCLAGCIAFVTIEHSARRFPRPVPAPLVGEHRLEDLIVEEDPPRPKSPDATAPSTMEAFDDLFEEPRSAPPAPVVVPEPKPAEAAAEPAPAPAPEAKTVEPAPEPKAAPETAPAPAPAATQTVAEPTRVRTAATATESPAPPAPRAEAPMPPRQRTAPEDGPMIPDNISELLLSEEGLDETDVTDVAATLVVADLRRSIEFYSDALGLQIVDRTDEAAVLEAGFGKILLWERPDAPPGEAGVMHLTFEVGDLDATFAQMNEAGVEFLHLPRTALLGQNYELRAASFRDPDGHGLAITEHRER